MATGRVTRSHKRKAAAPSQPALITKTRRSSRTSTRSFTKWTTSKLLSLNKKYSTRSKKKTQRPRPFLITDFPIHILARIASFVTNAPRISTLWPPTAGLPHKLQPPSETPVPLIPPDSSTETIDEDNDTAQQFYPAPIYPFQVAVRPIEYSELTPLRLTSKRFKEAADACIGMLYEIELAKPGLRPKLSNRGSMKMPMEVALGLPHLVGVHEVHGAGAVDLICTEGINWKYLALKDLVGQVEKKESDRGLALVRVMSKGAGCGLQVLRLSGESISEQDANMLLEVMGGSLKELELIDFRRCPHAVGFPANLDQRRIVNRRLEYLGLENCKKVDLILWACVRGKVLKRLDLKKCEFGNPELLEVVLKECPITHLGLHCQSGMTLENSIVHCCAKNDFMKGLRVLDWETGCREALEMLMEILDKVKNNLERLCLHIRGDYKEYDLQVLAGIEWQKECFSMGIHVYEYGKHEGIWVPTDGSEGNVHGPEDMELQFLIEDEDKLSMKWLYGLRDRLTDLILQNVPYMPRHVEEIESLNRLQTLFMANCKLSSKYMKQFTRATKQLGRNARLQSCSLDNNQSMITTSEGYVSVNIDDFAKGNIVVQSGDKFIQLQYD